MVEPVDDTPSVGWACRVGFIIEAQRANRVRPSCCSTEAKSIAWPHRDWLTMEAISVDMFHSFPVDPNENGAICVRNFNGVSRIVLYRLGRYLVE